MKGERLRTRSFKARGVLSSLPGPFQARCRKARKVQVRDSPACTITPNTLYTYTYTCSPVRKYVLIRKKPAKNVRVTKNTYKSVRASIRARNLRSVIKFTVPKVSTKFVCVFRLRVHVLYNVVVNRKNELSSIRVLKVQRTVQRYVYSCTRTFEGTFVPSYVVTPLYCVRVPCSRVLCFR